MPRKVLVGLLFAFSTLGCAPKEARDPSEIIAEEPDFLPPGYEESPPQERSGSKQAPAERLATRAECEAAARHLEALGLQFAISEAESPAERSELEAQKRELLGNAAARERIEQSTADCLGRETSAREAQCVSRVQSTDQIEACTR